MFGYYFISDGIYLLVYVLFGVRVLYEVLI